MGNLHRLALAFLDRFPMVHFVRHKATSIIIINSISIEVLRKLTYVYPSAWADQRNHKGV